MTLEQALAAGGLWALPLALLGGIAAGLNPCCLPIYPAVAATLAVAAGLAAALFHLGPPPERRLRKLDQERVSRLQRLRNDIGTHVAKERTLPGDLATLATKPWAERVALDPESREPFGYEVTGPWAYRLCADFARPSEPPPPDQRPGFWDHPQGKHCFGIEVEQPEEPAAAAGTGDSYPAPGPLGASSGP